MKIDEENWEFFLLGDMNVHLTPGITSANVIKLQHIFNIYRLNQLITEPARVTVNSCTLIDHCITNSPDKIAESGAIHHAISDHALIYITHKAKFERSGARIRKNPSDEKFPQVWLPKGPTPKGVI